MLTRCRALLLILALLGPASAYAVPGGTAQWSSMATISATSTIVTNTLCYNDGRDLVCDSSAGLRVTSGTVAFSNISATNISASTINGTPVGSLGGSGASKLASLTDVNVSSKVSGSVLVYAGATTSWTALPIQSVMSTTTMLTNWPDAIGCNLSTGTYYIYLATALPTSGGSLYLYRPVRNSGGDTYAEFNADGSYNSGSSTSDTNTSDCNGLSIAQLYATGRAFNFIGNSGTGGGTGTGDRIISGSLVAVANSATGYISLTTGVTNWGYLSSGQSYIPSLTSNFISTTALMVNGVSITGGGGTGDRITSGTTSMVVNSATGIISITNAGVTGGYFNANGVLTLPGISATANLTSVTTLYASNNVTIRGLLDIVTGTGVVGVGQGAAQSSTGVTGVTAVGYQAGQNNIAAGLTAIGYMASQNNPGGLNTVVGTQAAQNNTGYNVNVIGFNAGRNNVSDSVNAMGNNAAANNTGAGLVAIGEGAGQNNTGTNVTAVGGGAGSANTFSNVTLLGTGVYTAEKNNQVVLGNSSTIEVSTSGIYVGAGLKTAGVVTASYFEGDGSRLTGISTQGDRIVSGTLLAVANSATGYISLTTAGTNWGYLSNAVNYLPKLQTNTLSATIISVTAVQIVSQSSSPVTCNSGNSGTLRYNSPTTSLELCTGAGWQTMGVGIPAGTISAFASTTCPTGWSEYTAARGRFLRGIDNGAGNDPNGTRSPGGTQADAFQGFKPLWGSGGIGDGSSLPFGSVGGSYIFPWHASGTSQAAEWSLTSDGTNGTPRTSSETRPKNVAVIFCQFNGTSNGWNNPLSGGSTTPAGSTGDVQYNAGGAFSADTGNFTYSSGLLTVTNISTTNISVSTINGQPYSAGGGSGDRITSGTTGLTAISNTKTISITTNNTVTGYFNSNGVLTVPGISATANLTSVTTLAANQIQYNLLTGGTGIDPSFSVSASGADTQVQYNSGGNFAGSSSFTYASGLLTVTNISTTNISVSTINGVAVDSLGGTSDRITSGTTGLTAISNTKTISITTNNVVTGYFNSNGVLTVPGISATANLTSVTTLSANQIMFNLITGGTGVNPSFSVSASGADTQVQYNSSGSLAGSANFTFSGSNLLSVAGIISSTGVNVTGDISYTGVLTDTSDRRLKHDIKPLPFNSAMEKLMLMKPVQFKMNDRPDRTEWGFVAQDVEKLFPNLVFTANDAMGTKTLNYIGMIAPMVQGMQELQKENDDLRKRLDRLEKLVESQQQRH